MRSHTANELRDRVDILAANGSTVLLSNVCAGITDITGQRREQAQLVAAETTHMVLFRTGDIGVLSNSSYIRSGGVLYIVDYISDSRIPRPGIWTEVFCHVERTTS